MVNQEDCICIHRDSNIWFCTICTRDIFLFNGTEEDAEFLESIAEFQEADRLIPLKVLIDQNKIFTHLNLMKIKSYLLLTLMLMYSFITTSVIIACILVIITWKILLIRQCLN